MDKLVLVDEILKLKRERNAVIVAHSYQVGEIQEISDMVGDSYALSKYCTQQDNADVIVFCGVHFMAESAKILSPDKMVLLPEISAGCPMANMVDAKGLREKKREYPDAAVICYINSSAEVKAECDVCCTSSNAVNIVNRIDANEILFVPDRNLGQYIATKVPDKKMVFWEGYCPVHNNIKAENVVKVKGMYPDALLLIHPECTPEVCALADFIGSTKEIIEYAALSDNKKFIVGTEEGVLYSMRKDNPGKEFYLLDRDLVCKDMKITTLESVYKALSENIYEITLDEDVMVRARRSLERMLELGG